jgi:chromate transporter
VATVGIFLPAFIFVAVSGPLVPRVRRAQVAGAVLDGVNVASLTVGLAVASALLLIRYRINSARLILGGAMVGILVSAVKYVPYGVLLAPGWTARGHSAYFQSH